MSAPKGNKFAEGNIGGGREPEYKPEYCEQVEKLCKLGAIDKEIANFFGVSEQTINNWKLKYQEFTLALKSGKILADANVSESLYKRAMGYEHPEDDIKVVDKEIVITPTIKHYPPDSTAMIFWLKNRRSSEWRDKQEIEQHNTGDQIIRVIREEPNKPLDA